MKIVTTATAKAKLPALIESAKEGETIYITRHGRIVAQLTNASEIDAEGVNRAIGEIVDLRSRMTLGELTSASLKNEGRRA